jgi:flagellar hook-associated protein 1 FlgK
VANLLSIGSTALLSLQRALDVTGNNIANVNTEGFSRQQISFASLPTQDAGVGFIGRGVRVQSVVRSFDQFLFDGVVTRSASNGELAFKRDVTARLDQLLADPSLGISSGLEQFFAALQEVNSNPNGVAEREFLLGAGQSLAGRFQQINEFLDNLEIEISQRLRISVADVNASAQAIAQLNQRIVESGAQSRGVLPNDLLDARDLELVRLASQIGVTATQQPDGTLSVFVGNGQSLVFGFSAQELDLIQDPFDASRFNVAVKGAAGRQDISRSLTTGEVGAALQVRRDLLDFTRAELGVLATGVADTFNTQHRLGKTLEGSLGGDFFRPQEPVIRPATFNSGGASVTAAITDATRLAATSYRLTFDGSQWSLSDLRSGAVQVGPGPLFSVDGMEISIGGVAPAVGDSFLVQGASQALSQFAVVLPNAASFAAASPVRVTAVPDNAGTARLRDLQVESVAGLPLAGTVSLVFDPDALGGGVPGYVVTGLPGGPLAFDPATESVGKVFTLGGLRFRLEGTPAPGDRFELSDNSGAVSDNRNVAKLAALQFQSVLASGTASFQQAYGRVIGAIGAQSRQIGLAADAEDILLREARNALESRRGVNLDEEATNLLRFQQAYQAAARVISVADSLFQTLLSSTAR